jgi:hypothetical protein
MQKAMTDAKKELADLTERLRARIAAAPKNSHTASAAAAQIDDIARVAGLTPEQKAAALRETLRDFGRNLQLDAIHHAPNCAPERDPLRPVKPAGGDKGT